MEMLSPSSAKFRCPLSTKIVEAIVRERSLKHLGKPWQGPLPKPGISPPKTLGNAVVKNSFNRLRGGQLIPKSVKMSLPSTTSGSQENYSHVSLDDQSEEWPPLPNFAGTQGKKATLPSDRGLDRILLINRKGKVWFRPSKGLNVFFSQAGPKPCGLKTPIKEP
jgi:hypothetical protein